MIQEFLGFVCLIVKRKQYNVKLEVNSTEITFLFFFLIFLCAQKHYI